MNATIASPQRKQLIGFRACLLTLMIMVCLAYLITTSSGPGPLWAAAQAGQPWALQIAWGIAIGLAVAIPAWSAALKVEAFAAFKNQMLELVQKADLRAMNPLWFALCAGIGEEVLARGAVQPLMGIWWTSLIFTVAHYKTIGFRSMNRAKWGYTASVFLASLVLGFVMIELGLIAAMVSHSVVDLYGLLALRTESSRPELAQANGS
jgi:hypothetical protein